MPVPPQCHDDRRDSLMFRLEIFIRGYMLHSASTTCGCRSKTMSLDWKCRILHLGSHSLPSCISPSAMVRRQVSPMSQRSGIAQVALMSNILSQNKIFTLILENAGKKGTQCCTKTRLSPCIDACYQKSKATQFLLILLSTVHDWWFP